MSNVKRGISMCVVWMSETGARPLLDGAPILKCLADYHLRPLYPYIL